MNADTKRKHGWAAAISDTIVETHDRIVGKTWREAKKICDAQVDAQKVTIEQTLCSFAELGAALLAAKADGSDLDAAIADHQGWAHILLSGEYRWRKKRS
ncbi:MAG: hypothetical protein ABJ246_18765 [Paracoccaceae bacterium]